MLDTNTYIQTIKDLFPDAYIYKDHPFTDLIVTPVDILRNSLQVDIDYQKSILGLDVNMPEDELDKIAANYQVTRATGSKSKGSVTIAMNVPTTFNTSGLYALTGEGLRFQITRTLPIRVDEFIRNGSYYTIRLDVLAEATGSNYNITPGSVNRLEGFFLPLLFVTNESAFVGGSDTQSNDQVITAIQNSITDRSLTRKTGLAVKLINDFPDFLWVKAIGTGDQEMKRDVYTINGIQIHIGNVADVYLYPTSGYMDDSQDLILSIDSQQIIKTPAIGPYDVIGSDGVSIPPIYWTIKVRDIDYDNSVLEEKVINFLHPKNVFTTLSPTASDFIQYGILKEDEMLINYTTSGNSRSSIIGVNQSSIYLIEEFPDLDVVGRAYNLIREADSPYIKYDATTDTFRLYDTGVSDFTTLVTDPFWITEPYLHLYQVALIDKDNNYYFLDITAVDVSYIQLSGSYDRAPVKYLLIQSRIMEKKVALKFESWIETYHYFKASLVTSVGTPARMTEDVIVPLITQLTAQNLYIEIAGGYYLITNINLEGQTLFVQIKYDSSVTNIALLTNQGVYSLVNQGRFHDTSSISDVAVEPTRLYFRTYPISSVQAALDNNDYRIITTDYLARIPYEVEVRCNIKYKGSVTVNDLSNKITAYINGLTPISGISSTGYLQASDIISVCYQNGVDYIDLSTFSVIISIYAPLSDIEWSPVELIEYELYGEDIKRNLVFKYYCTSDDLTITEIL